MLLHNNILLQIANSLHVSAAEIALGWLLQKGVYVIPTSSKTDYLASGRATDEQTKQLEERSIERGGTIGTGGQGSKIGQHFPPIRCETDDAVLSDEVRI